MGARAVCLMLEVFVWVGVSGKCARGCIRSLQCVYGVDGCSVYMGVSGEYARGCVRSPQCVYGVDGCKSCVLNAGGVRVCGCEW